MLSTTTTEVRFPSSVEVVALPYQCLHKQYHDTILMRFDKGSSVIEITCAPSAPDAGPGESGAVIAQALADGFAEAAARLSEAAREKVTG